MRQTSEIYSITSAQTYQKEAKKGKRPHQQNLNLRDLPYDADRSHPNKCSQERHPTTPREAKQKVA